MSEKKKPEVVTLTIQSGTIGGKSAFTERKNGNG